MHLYILYSSTVDRYYIGETHDLEKRMIQHTTEGYKGSFTKSASDWELKLSRSCVDREEALFLERFIKRMKSRKFIFKVILNPSVLEAILSKR